MPATRRSARSQARKLLSSPVPPVSVSRKPRGSTPADQTDEEPEADTKSGVTSNDDEDTPAETAEKPVKLLPQQSRRRRSRASPGVAPSEQGSPPAARRTRRRTLDEPADAAPSDDVGEPDTVDEDVPLLPLHAETVTDKGRGDEDIADDTSDVAPEDIAHSNAEVTVETDVSDRPVLLDNPDEDSGSKAVTDTKVVETEPETHQTSIEDPSRNESTRPDQTCRHQEATRSVNLSNVTEAHRSSQSTLPPRKENEEPIDQKSAIDEGLLDERKPLKAELHIADKGTALNLSNLSQVVAPSPDSSNDDEVASPPEPTHMESKTIGGKAVEGSEARVNIESIPTNDEANCANDTSVVSSSDRDVMLAADVIVAPAGGHTEAKTTPMHKSEATESAVAQTSAQHLLDDDKEVQSRFLSRNFPSVTVVNVEERDDAVISSGTIEGDPLNEVEAICRPSLHFAGQSLAPSDVNDVPSKDSSTVTVDIAVVIGGDSPSVHQEIFEAQRSDFSVVDSVETVKGREELLERKEFNMLAVGGVQGSEALDNGRNEGAEHHELEIEGEGILEANDSCQKEKHNDADLQNKIDAKDETIPGVSSSTRQRGGSDLQSGSATCSPLHESIRATPALTTDVSNAEHVHAKNSDSGQWVGDNSMIQEFVTSKRSVGTGKISIDKEFVTAKVHDTAFASLSQNGSTNGISQEEQHVLTIENSASCTRVAPVLVRSETSQRTESVDIAPSNSDVGTLSQTGRKVARRVTGVTKPPTSVQAIKVRIYSAGVVAHRGKGAEKLFASYWGALCRCFGTRLQGDGSDKRAWMLKGSRDVIKTFLTTRKLRRLHNSLILGLLDRCADDTASADDVAAHIPSPWRRRVHVIRKDDARHCISIESNEFETAIKSDFQTQSRLWTSADVPEELFTIPENIRPSLSLGMSARTDDNSPPLPGALLVDPYVRSAAQREGLKVSENAVWLVVVGMREYVKSLLKNTIATIDSVNEIRELPLGSALLSPSEPVEKPGDISKANEAFVRTSTTIMSGKRKRVSALDVAACLMSSPVNRGHRANRLAFENCYLSAFDVHPVTSHGGFESIQHYVSSGITIASPKRPRTQKDSQFQPPEIAPHGGLADAKTISDRPQPDVLSNRPSAKSGSVAPPHPTQARRSPIKGMGRGAKNLEALKARAAAAASAAKNDTQATGASSASHQTVVMNDNAEPAKPSTKPTEDAALPPEPRSAPSQSSLSSNPRQSFPMHRKGPSPATERPATGSRDGSKVAVGFAGTTKAAAPSSGESAVSQGMLQSDLTTAQVGSHGALKSVERQPHEPSSSADRAGETAPLLDSGSLAPRADTSSAQRPAVRGRGLGVKNLAMMRARSAGGIVDVKDEGNDADVGKHSDELAQSQPPSTAGAHGDSNESKAEGDHGNSAMADVSKPLETRKTASGPIAESELEFMPNVGQRFDDKGLNEAVTSIAKYQQVGKVETLEASSEAVAQLSEQGQPLAYKV